MRFEIEYTPEAVEDMRFLSKRDQKFVTTESERRLEFQAAEETRNRKRLRPNQLAEWELRIGKIRVFYDVDSRVKRVKIVAVGYKIGSRLLIGGEEFDL